MTIDWMLVATVGTPIVALFVGAALDRALERKPKLVAYFAHASVFNIRTDPESAQPIHTHSIVIRNVGRRPATSIRVGHHFPPPNFHVYPDCSFEIHPLPRCGSDLLFPTLVPGDQVTISYLYFPPLLYNQIHWGIRHSEGFARELTVLPTPQLPPWRARIAAWAHHPRRNLFAVLGRRHRATPGWHVAGRCLTSGWRSAGEQRTTVERRVRPAAQPPVLARRSRAQPHRRRAGCPAPQSP
jgi:hypothetical protein